MKKTLLSMLAVTTVIGVASGDDISKRRERCLKHPDKYVWAANTAACVPIDACNRDNYSAYCNMAFAGKALFDSLDKDKSENAINEYVKRQLGWQSGCNSQISSGLHIMKDGRFFVCLTLDGRYMSFKIGGPGSGDSQYMYQDSLCIAFAGQDYMLFNIVTGDNTHVCDGISEQDCASLSELLNISPYEYQDDRYCIVGKDHYDLN